MPWQLCSLCPRKKIENNTNNETSTGYAPPKSDTPVALNISKPEQTEVQSQSIQANVPSTAGDRPRDDSSHINRNPASDNSFTKVSVAHASDAEQEPTAQLVKASTPKLTDQLETYLTSNINTGLWKEAREGLDEQDLLRLEQFISIGDGDLQRAVEERLEAIKDSRLLIEVNGKEHTVRNGAQKVLETLSRYEPFIKAATAAESNASLAWGGISAFLPLLSTALSRTDDALKDLEAISHMLVKFRAIEVVYGLSESKSEEPMHIRDCHNKLKSTTVEIYTKVLGHQLALMHHYEKNQLLRMAKNMSLQPIGDLASIKDLEKSAEGFMNTLNSSSIQNLDTGFKVLRSEVNHLENLAKKSYRTLLDVAQRQVLEKLPKAEGASYNAVVDGFKLPQCHENTRTQVLDRLRYWAEGTDGEECVFWLNGMAGTGKSTISRTFAQELDNEGRLGASFFFSRGLEDRGKSAKLFSTLALELAEKVAGFGESLCKSVLKKGGIEGKDLDEQWTALILEPLEDLGSSLLAPLDLVIVIDALDECHGQKVVPHLIHLLLTAKRPTNIQLRVLVTSRNETDIIESFNRESGVPWMSLEDETIADSTQSDISIYIRDELLKIANKKSLGKWPEEKQILGLLEFSEGLFIAAATTCRYFDSSELPEDKLCEFLKAARTTSKGTASLDEMYRLIIRPFLSEGVDQEEVNKYFKAVVGAILVSKEPISVVEMASLLCLNPKYIYLILNGLRSFLVIPESDTSPIRLFHLSFRDFLTNKERCKDEAMFIDENEAHRQIFGHCLGHLSHSLKKDICGLIRPGTLLAEIEGDVVIRHIPRTVRYACQYWALHLKDAKISQPGTTQMTHALEFLRLHLLHWIEALAIIDCLNDAVTGIADLKIVALATREQDFGDFVNDAHRFILYHKTVIEKAPLQVYYMASVFSPTESLVRTGFSEHYPAFLSKSPIMERHWGLEVQSLSSKRFFQGFAISADERMVACAAWGSISVWDVVTGSMKYAFEIGDPKGVGCWIFSPNGNELTALFLSSDEHHPIRISKTWSLVTGQQLAAIGENRPDFLTLCDLSSWSWRQGFDYAEEKESLKFVLSFAMSEWSYSVSTDGAAMALFAAGRVHIGSTQLRQIIGTWNFDLEISRVTLSTTRAVIKLQDHTIKILEIGNDRPAEDRPAELQIPDQSVLLCISLSLDGTRLACGFDTGVEIWNLDSRKMEHAVEIPHTSSQITSLGLFPRGTKLMVQLMGERTAQLWDLEHQELSSPSAFYNPGGDLVLSPDGTKLAFVDCKPIQYWDHITEKPILEPQALIEAGNIAFGENPVDPFASSYTKAVEEAKTRYLVGSYKHAGLILSSDKSHVLVHSTWEFPFSFKFKCADTGNTELEFVGPIRGKQSVWSATLSHKATMIAWIFLYDATCGTGVEIWDVQGEDIKKIEYPGDGATNPRSMIFSPQDTRIAIGWSNHRVSIHNIATGLVEHQLKGPSWLISSLRFSCDDSWIKEPFYSLDEGEQWVTYDDKRLLALPQHFRGVNHYPGAHDCRGNVIVYRSQNGRIASFVFKGAPELHI